MEQSGPGAFSEPRIFFFVTQAGLSGWPPGVHLAALVPEWLDLGPGPIPGSERGITDACSGRREDGVLKRRLECGYQKGDGRPAYVHRNPAGADGLIAAQSIVLTWTQLAES